MPLGDGVRITVDQVGREEMVEVIPEATKLLAEPIKCELKRFVVNTTELEEGKCIHLLVSYCYDIPDGEVI